MISITFINLFVIILGRRNFIITKNTGTLPVFLLYYTLRFLFKILSVFDKYLSTCILISSMTSKSFSLDILPPPLNI